MPARRAGYRPPTVNRAGTHNRTTNAHAALLLACAGLVAGLPIAPAFAQPESPQGDGAADASQPPAPPPVAPGTDLFEGRPVAEVVFRVPAGEGFAPLAGNSLQRALNNVRTVPGGAFRGRTVAEDTRRLNRLALFASVETSAQALPDGSARLIFTLVERQVIQDVQVAGNTRIPDRDIAAEVDLLAGTPVDPFQLDRAARRIQDLYRERGYYFADVTIDRELLDESGIVLYQIREGERVKVTAIRFVGNTSIETRLLRRELETKTAALFRRGQLDDDNLDVDIANLITYYRNEGFLDVRADRRITPSPNGREAIVTYILDEGPRYTLRSVELEARPAQEGDLPVFDAAQVAGLLEIKPGDVFGVEALDASVQAVSDAYGRLGFTDVRVTRVEKRDPQRPVVDLVIVVSEGLAYLTGEVIIQGNEITRQNVVRRQIEVLPERPLDSIALRRSEALLRRTRLFNPRGVKLTLQPPDPRDPEYRDILAEVEETNTGNIAFGGAVSSDSGVVGRIALTQNNFDLFDTPDSLGDFFSGRSFRGAGQTFRLEALPGDEIQTYSVSLSDPALFDTDYSGSASLFFRDREFDEFDEQRFGARLGFGRAFGTRWRGNLTLRAESVELSDIPAERPTDIFDVADQNIITSLGLSFTRDTLDNRFRPSSGSRTVVGIEQAGALGGDFTFTKISAQHRVFVAIREDFLGRDTVLSFNTEVGYIPQGRDDVPTYERFYLGGQSFRGFDFRTVSPKGIRNDNGQPSDDPVGGTFLFFAGVELNQPIFEDIFAAVLFIDSGTVLFDPGFEEYRVSTGFGLRFSIPQLSPAPIALDFGFPLVKGDRDEERLFTFTVDLPF